MSLKPRLPEIEAYQKKGAEQALIIDILRESLEHENTTLNAYRELFKFGKSVTLQEYAREMIYAEEMQLGEVDKMLRKPCDLGVFQS